MSIVDNDESKNNVIDMNDANNASGVVEQPSLTGTNESNATKMFALVRLKNMTAAVMCVIVVIAVGMLGWNMGKRSVNVLGSEQYQAKVQELKRAQSDLKESQQDADSSKQKLDEASNAVSQVVKEKEHYQDLVKEFSAVNGDANPLITVKAVGPAQFSYGYHVFQITIHNNTANTLSFYEIRYQFTDDTGNITNTYFAVSTDGCAPNTDCVITSTTTFDPTGMTFTPISWDTGADGNYGRYGTDVVTRRM